MSDLGSSNLPWWKAKELSLKRKAALAVRSASAMPGDSFLIITEGKVTEPVYFKLLRDSLELATVRVKILHKATDPRHVIDAAAEEVKALARRVKKKQAGNTEVSKYDHVWAVIDTDVAVRKGFWSDVVQLAKTRKVKIAHSTPCFEFWLLLHMTYTTRSDLLNGTLAKEAVEEALGQDYSTNEETAKKIIPSFLSKWSEAVTHAQRIRNHHAAAQTPAPGNPSTEVDLLTCALNDAAPPHKRKLACV